VSQVVRPDRCTELREFQYGQSLAWLFDLCIYGTSVIADVLLKFDPIAHTDRLGMVRLAENGGLLRHVWVEYEYIEPPADFAEFHKSISGELSLFVKLGNEVIDYVTIGTDQSRMDVLSTIAFLYSFINPKPHHIFEYPGTPEEYIDSLRSSIIGLKMRMIWRYQECLVNMAHAGRNTSRYWDEDHSWLQQEDKPWLAYPPGHPDYEPDPNQETTMIEDVHWDDGDPPF
jgi:hypothetical protein